MKRDKQNPPDEKQTRAPGPDTSAVPSSVAGSETPDDMNADEQAVFDQIMGEIEGQESETDGDAAKLSSDNQTVSDAENDALDDDQQKAFESIMAQIEGGGAATNADGDDASTPTDPPVEADDDFSAELEKVAKATDGVAEAPAETPPEDAGDALDDDQQKAFESIMAQIEGGGTETDADGDDASTPTDPPAEADDDFSAELEKVAKAADGDAEAPAETPPEDAGDALDDDQQKAFESIMAQIEGGGTDTKDDTTASDDEPPGDQSDSEDALSATATEKVAKSPEQLPAEPASDASEGDPDEDPQQALDSVMAEIEGQRQTSATNADRPAPPLMETDGSDPSEATTEKSAEPESISDDIEAILKEITLSEDDGAEGPDEGTQSDGLAENREDADDIVVGQNGDGGPKNPDEPSQEPPDNPSASDSDDVSVEPSAPQRPPAAKEAGHHVDAAPQAPVPLPEAGPAGPKRRRSALVATLMMIILVAAAGIYYRYLRLPETAPPPSAEVHPLPVKDPKPADNVHHPVVMDAEPTEEDRWQATITGLNALRDELMAKQSEIRELRAYYQAGIDAEYQSMIEIVHQQGAGRISFTAAKNNPRIRLGLEAIQRRAATIQKLDDPLTSLQQRCEDLLYLSRRAELLAMLADTTSDIDVEAFEKSAEDALLKHRRALAQLNIDSVEVATPSLESLWKTLETRMPKKSAPSASSTASVQTDNSAIWNAICNGDFTRKHQLSQLSPSAARCLAGWKGKDLYLNELTELSPEAARELSAWEGNWLGLNGLETLTPEAATHLSRWKGRGLSLNGLTRLSPRVVAILSEWQGDQIELVNVKHMAHWENPNTRLFLSEAMQRKLHP